MPPPRELILPWPCTTIPEGNSAEKVERVKWREGKGGGKGKYDLMLQVGPGTDRGDS